MEMEEKKELLKHYADEWKYRNTHYWKLISKHLYFGVIVIMFPYLGEYLGILSSASLSPLFFQIAGVVVSALFCYLLLCENARMNRTGRMVWTILEPLVQQLNTEKKERAGQAALDGKYKDLSKIPSAFKLPLGYIIPVVILIFHILLAILY